MVNATKRYRGAIIVVDVQNDFCPGGSLPVPNGNEVISALNAVLELAQQLDVLVFASRDWHPAETSHFADFGGVWPTHCVQDTEGAAFHPDLHLPATAHVLSKGTLKDEDAYSAFQGHEEQGDDGLSLAEILKTEGVETVWIGGLATDYCVKATALDAVRNGFTTVLLVDACRAVDIHEGDGDRALEEMAQAGVKLMRTFIDNSQEVK
ncbi:MAG: nicotinamidase [Candidatus Spechtbacteria bacterium]|nr:nicotinamidase [Candidatus Spechtbacteria bacterium]